MKDNYYIKAPRQLIGGKMMKEDNIIGKRVLIVGAHPHSGKSGEVVDIQIAVAIGKVGYKEG